MKNRRRELFKKFIRARIESSLRDQSDVIINNDNEFRYLKEQDFDKVLEELEKSIDEYLSYGFDNLEYFADKENNEFKKN